MAFSRRNTQDDATWARAWTADTFADLTSVSAIKGSERPHHGDIAFVQDESKYYLWMDDDTWQGIGGGDSVIDPGSVATPVGDYTLINDNIGILCNATHIITLPFPSDFDKRIRYIVNNGTGIVTVNGTLIDNGRAKTVTKLAAGEVIIFSALSINWAILNRVNVIRCKVTIASPQAIVSDVLTRILWDFEYIDNFNEFSSNQWIASEDMAILVTTQAYLESVTLRAQLFIFVNGNYISFNSMDAEGGDWVMNVSWQGEVLKDDVLEIYIRHSHGSNRPLVNGLRNTILTIRRVA